MEKTENEIRDDGEENQEEDCWPTPATFFLLLFIFGPILAFLDVRRLPRGGGNSSLGGDGEGIFFGRTLAGFWLGGSWNIVQRARDGRGRSDGRSAMWTRTAYAGVALWDK
jgi:hypothetical protein